MAKSKRNTEYDPEIPDGLQIERLIDHTCYTGNRAEILRAGILPPELLPKKFQAFDVVFDGRRITGSKCGCGKWTRWEIFVESTIEESRARRLQEDNRVHPALAEIARQLYVWANQWIGPDNGVLSSAPGFKIAAGDENDIHSTISCLYHKIRDAEISLAAADCAAGTGATPRPTLTLIQGGQVASD